ncbi:hypothetical protein Mal15_49820 [Stieleria maiorica]|uniref:HEAT repeat domain-containing protein n=1 Tax=Stieleria maiorica TaxID=2795974 RepID=A0A5B9MMY9_9BACT|nr:hypothetical protein [Stieleria maiorica]QEG00906.1 hypothetical protein Mal15_49820 [Stieleria maiorica]
MRYPYLIALAMLMAMPTVSTPADEPTADQRLKAAGSPPPCPKKRASRRQVAGVFSESGLARFRLRSGRLDVDPMRYRKGSQEHSAADFHESITVSSSSGVPSVYYRYADDYQRVQVVAEHGKSLRMESTIIATGEQAVLDQRETGEIEWNVRRDPNGESELDHRVSGPTLLHIVGQDEAGFQIHLDMLISRMLLGRSVIDLAHRTEAFLQQNASRLIIVSADEVNALIDQLRAAKSSQRRAATTALAGFGTSAIPYLTTALGRSDLDVEQRARIRMLISRGPRIDEDTPSSLACLLSTDRQHWQIMAKKMNRDQWIAANDHVRRCGLDALTR